MDRDAAGALLAGVRAAGTGLCCVESSDNLVGAGMASCHSGSNARFSGLNAEQNASRGLWFGLWHGVRERPPRPWHRTAP
eukprot:5501096-Prymnesium_polylepis.1